MYFTYLLVSSGAIALTQACSSLRVSVPESDVIGRTMELGGEGLFGVGKVDRMFPWKVVVHPYAQNMGGSILCEGSLVSKNPFDVHKSQH